jgi:hypothetical protein
MFCARFDSPANSRAIVLAYCGYEPTAADDSLVGPTKQYWIAVAYQRAGNPDTATPILQQLLLGDDHRAALVAKGRLDHPLAPMDSLTYDQSIVQRLVDNRTMHPGV